MKYLTVFCALFASIFIVTSAQAEFFDDSDFDGSDLSVCADAFGAGSDQSNYHAACDFILDGDVDLVDLRAFAARFGKTNCYSPAAIGEVGPEGGAVEVTDPDSPIYGTRAEIPAGALLLDTVITIAAVPSPPGTPGNGSSHLAIFEPSVNFEKEVIVYLNYPDVDNDGVIDETNSSETGVSVCQYDENTNTWMVFPPDYLDTLQNRIGVDTRVLSTWSWGLGSADMTLSDNSAEPFQYINIVGLAFSEGMEVTVGDQVVSSSENPDQQIEFQAPALSPGRYPVKVKLGNIIYSGLELEVLELSLPPEVPGAYFIQIKSTLIELIDILISTGELSAEEAQQLSEQKTTLLDAEGSFLTQTTVLIEAALYRDGFLALLEDMLSVLQQQETPSLQGINPNVFLTEQHTCKYGQDGGIEYVQDGLNLLRDMVYITVAVFTSEVHWGSFTAIATGNTYQDMVGFSAKIREADQQCPIENACEWTKCDYWNGACITGSFADNTACDDGISCTLNDRCVNGSCTGFPDDNLCGGQDFYDADCDYGRCDPSAGCIDTRFEPSGLAGGCDDGIACTVNDHCDGAGNCLPGEPNHSLCPGNFSYEDDDCTLPSCDPAVGCTADGRLEPSGLAGGCDDGIACTVNDHCDGAGNCLPGEPNHSLCPGDFSYEDDDCTLPTCDPAVGCTADGRLEPSGLAGGCDDGIACTVNDHCDGAGNCLPGEPNHSLCPGDFSYEDDDCTLPTCDPAVGCTADGRLEPSGLAGGCDDGNTCTSNDHCDGAGNCIGDNICL